MTWMNSELRGNDSATDLCPSRGTLFDYLQGGSTTEGEDRIGRHLERCENCLSVAEELTSPDQWAPSLRAVARDPSTVNSQVQGPCETPNGGQPVAVTVGATLVDTERRPPRKDDVQWSDPRLTAPAVQNGRFCQLTPIGRGGCANVYKAEDTALGRTVALKVPHASLMADPRANVRFLTELRATAALHHPHIVALYDAGLVGQQSFIVFEYVSGPTLANWISNQSQPIAVRTAAMIVARLADGIHHAHEARILHRDLKPSNVLLDESRSSGELPFVPRIADFGIARILNSDVTHTIDDVVLGSPPFMSPEQALGDRNRIGPASDVYALGGILYQLLTRQLPIQGASAADTLRRVLTDEPIAPRRLRPDIPRDLEAICLKCLEKNQQNRYPSAAALERDLERYLAGEPVSVRRPALWETVSRAARQHPVWTILSGSIAIMIALVVGLLTRHSAAVEQLANQLSEKNTELGAANQGLAEALGEAKSARDEARESVYAYDMRRAFDAAKTGDARMVQSLLNRYADGTDLAPYRGIEWHYLWLRTQHLHREVFRATQPIYMATLSPNGGTLAVVGQDAFVRLFDWPSGKLTDEWPTGQREVNGACFAPDGDGLWTAGDDGTVRLWNRTDHACLYSINAHGPNNAFEIAYDAEQDRIMTCGREATIRVWDAQTGDSRGELAGHKKKVDTIQLHPDGRRLVSQSADETMRIWDLTSLTCEREIVLPADQDVSYLRLSPDGQWLAAVSKSELVLYDLLENAEILRCSTINEPERVCFDETSRRLFVGDRIGAVEEWILGQEGADKTAWSKSDRTWQAHQARISYMEGSQFTEELVTAGWDGQVLAWGNFDDDSSLQQELQHRVIADFVALPAEDCLLIASEDGLTLEQVGIDAGSGRATSSARLLDDHPYWNRVAVTLDGRLLASGTTDGRVAVWRRTEDRPYLEISAFTEDYVLGLSFTPDGRHLCATASRDGKAVWLDTVTGHVEPLPLANRCGLIEFAADGGAYASTFEMALKVVDLPSRRLKCELPGPSAFGRTMQFLADGKSLVVAEERKVLIYDTTSGQPLRELLGQTGKITGLAVSADGRTLVTTGVDGSVQLWHVPTGQQLHSFETGPAPWGRCCFLNNDDWLAYSLDTDRIRVVRMQ